MELKERRINKWLNVVVKKAVRKKAAKEKDVAEEDNTLLSSTLFKGAYTFCMRPFNIFFYFFVRK